MTIRKRLSFRFTIERLRTLVLVGGVLIVAAIGIFLAAGQWRRHFLTKDLPKRLGIDIQQQADGVNYTQSRKGKTLFKIHAAKAVQMKKDGRTLLHDVRIDLYGEDGQSADTISGSEFEYDPGAGLAQAAGAVEITIKRPGEKPAIAQLKPQDLQSALQPKAGKALEKIPVIATQVANQEKGGEIHVKTSGLSFDQRSGIATTAQRVDFVLQQGSGSSVGATFDSGNGQLILDHSVDLHVQRPGSAVTLQAGHAEFERSQKVCSLSQARAGFSGSILQSGNAFIHFSEDGSVTRMEGSNGVDLVTAAGSHLTAPRGNLDFDTKNHPRRGLLEGGTRLDVTQSGREMHGSAPTAQLSFDPSGQLQQAHLEKGVVFDSRQRIPLTKGGSTLLHRSWLSSTADLSFEPVRNANKPPSAGNQPGGQGSDSSATALASTRREIRTIHGLGAVVLSSESVGDPTAATSRLSANSVVAELASGGQFKSLTASGNAAFEQQTADGAHQASSSDRLEVVFASPTGAKASNTPANPSSGLSATSEIASIVQYGHVVFVQTAPIAHSRPNSSRMADPDTRATSDRADYDGQTQVLYLSGAPRIQNGGLQLSALKIDFSRVTGDAYAHGDVKASWATSATPTPPYHEPSQPITTLPGSTLLRGTGANGPIHAIAAEAELHRESGEVIFHESARSSANVQPRFWQGANSISAPLILLNRQKLTLTATARGSSKPVRTVLVGNTEAKPLASGRAATPSLIRLRSGELHYSEGERIAQFRGGTIGSVTAETTSSTGTAGNGVAATIVAQQADLRLMPAGAHPKAGPGGSGAPADSAANSTANSPVNSPVNAAVDQLTARGHVTVDWPGRHGIGETLVYQSDDGTFTLTGTAAAPPRITDQTRGTVSGSALIFHSRDDSVTVVGDGAKTVTETQSPK